MRLFRSILIMLGALICTVPNSAIAQTPDQQHTEGKKAADVGEFLQARAHYTAACEGMNLEACVELAYLFSKGKGGAPDAVTARLFFEKACNGGLAVGCAQAASMLSRGDGNLMADRVAARLLYNKACNAGIKFSCYELETMLQWDERIARSSPEAVARHDKACDKGVAKSCMELEYLRGRKWFDDLPKLKRTYVEACKLGQDDICIYLRDVYGYGWENGKDLVEPEVARALLIKDCDGGKAESCFKLGLRLANGHESFEGDKVWGNRAAGYIRFTEACNAGYAAGCSAVGSELADLLSKKRDVIAARAALIKGCNGGDLFGCTTLGEFLRWGNLGEKDPAGARAFFIRACDGGEANGCGYLADMLARGEGGDANEPLAKTYSAKACQLDSSHPDCKL